MMGLPMNSPALRPSCLWRERCPKPRRVSGAKKRWLRSSSGFLCGRVLGTNSLYIRPGSFEGFLAMEGTVER